MAGSLQGTDLSGDTLGGYRPMSEINVTPFVDVMLVLLIIFMVAAPLMMVGVPLDLPKTDAARIGQTREPIIRSAERRVGKEGVRKCRSRGGPEHQKKKKT